MVDLFPHLAKLQGFLAVAREGSFHKAARALRMSQPSLSQSVQNLELAIGEALFVRSPRGVTLTSTGTIVLEFANRLEGSLLSLRAALVSQGQPLGRHLRVGVYESAAIYIWPSTIKLLKVDLPELEVSLVTGRSSELMQALSERELDVALVIEPEQDPVMNIRTLYSDQFAFYLSAKLALQVEERFKGKKRLPLALLSDFPLILFHSARVSSDQRLEDVVLAQGVDRRSLLRVESFEVAKEFCRQGFGLALLPTRVAETSLTGGSLVRVYLAELPDREFGRHRFCYCFRADHWELGSIRALEKIVRRVT